MSRRVRLIALFVLVAAAGAWLGAQEQPPASTTQEFWIQRAPGGKGYVPPNKPHTKLSDMKAKHKGQSSWRETAVKDGESQADYVSMAPGTKVSPRLHPATPTLFVVFEGEMRWQIEKQEAFTAKRGSMVHVPSWTIFSYEAVGAAPAIFIEVNAAHYEPVFPATSPAPAALPGRVVTKTRFQRRVVRPPMRRRTGRTSTSTTRLQPDVGAACLCAPSTCMPTPIMGSPTRTIRPIRIAGGEAQLEVRRRPRSAQSTRMCRAVTCIPITSSGGSS